MRLDDIERLPPSARAHVAREIYEHAVTTIVERLLEEDPTTVPARPLYGVYQAYATGQMGDLHKTIAELGVEKTGDEDPRIKREIVRRLGRAYELADDIDGQREEERRCRDDVAYWIDNWGWARDPERDGLRVIPFRPFDRQRELLDWIEELIAAKEPGYMDKARKVGASYLFAFFSTHRWKFCDHWTTFLSSYSEAALHTQHKPDECIIEKVRVIIRGLPSWQIPTGYNERDHFNFCSVVNPENGSAIAGILPKGENFRSTRATVAFLDEFPYYRDAQDQWTTIADVTPTPIALGTPSPGSYASELKKKVSTFVFTWRDDPRKSQEPVEVEVGPGKTETMPKFKADWLSAGGRTEADFEREHECNSDIVVSQNVIKSEWIDAAERIELQPVGECVCGLDPAGLGGDEASFCRRVGPVVDPLTTWQSDIRQTTEMAAGLTSSRGGEFLYFDASGLGSQCRDHLADMEDLEFGWWGIYQQNPPPTIFIGDDEDPADERYADMATMLWFSLAARLEHTYRHFHGLDRYPPDQLLSLPHDPELREQLLSRRWEWRSGKIKLEDKKKMRKSPDRADSLAQTECTHLQREKNRPSGPATADTVDPDIDRQMGGRGFDIEF